jgi:hypothetical protein
MNGVFVPLEETLPQEGFLTDPAVQYAAQELVMALPANLQHSLQTGVPKPAAVPPEGRLPQETATTETFPATTDAALSGPGQQAGQQMKEFAAQRPVSPPHIASATNKDTMASKEPLLGREDEKKTDHPEPNHFSESASLLDSAGTVQTILQPMGSARNATRLGKESGISR